MALPEYLAAVVATPWFHEHLKGLTRGVGARRERARPEAFLQLEMEMPNVERQAQAIPTLLLAQAARRRQKETRTQSDWLLPAMLNRAFRGGV
jgi:type I restriction enzyme S subunit